MKKGVSLIALIVTIIVIIILMAIVVSQPEVQTCEYNNHNYICRNCGKSLNND